MTTLHGPPYRRFVQSAYLRRRTAAFTLFVGLLSGCSREPVPAAAGPHLPEGPAGVVIARAIDASGGWPRWRAMRDVAHVSTLHLLNPFGALASESVGLFAAPLHGGINARMDSIGLAIEARLGVHDDNTWILVGGQPVDDPARLELTRFNLLSNRFWMSLPFSLGEMPAKITDRGDVEGEGGQRWHRVEVAVDEKETGAPGGWFVLYFEEKTGLLERVHARLHTSFLTHENWMGLWSDYREWQGIKKERQRLFYPANESGEIVGAVVAEQLVELIRFNNSFGPTYFDQPIQSRGGPMQSAGRARSSQRT